MACKKSGVAAGSRASAGCSVSGHGSSARAPRLSRARAPQLTACQAIISFSGATELKDHDLAVEIFETDLAVGKRVCDIVEAAAQAAVAVRGKFFLAVPGGSVLKMCAGLVGRNIEWRNTYIFYANHKCVSMEDSSATHKKAMDTFITKVGMPAGNVAALDGTSDAPAEAAAYAAKLMSVAQQQGMEMTPAGVPRFDVMLLGMGADGHVGSLYPDRAEINMTDKLVLPVAKKDPASITLSLPVMNAARHIAIAATGANKSSAIKTTVETKVDKPEKMPAAAVKPLAGGKLTWLLDTYSADRLGANKALDALLYLDASV